MIETETGRMKKIGVSLEAISRKELLACDVPCSATKKDGQPIACWELCKSHEEQKVDA